MEDKPNTYFALDSLVASVVDVMERANKRLYIIVVILILALIFSNTAWALRECLYEDYVCETTIDADQDASMGGNNVIIGGGYGEAER